MSFLSGLLYYFKIFLYSLFLEVQIDDIKQKPSENQSEILPLGDDFKCGIFDIL
jgi:hypothetical protein